MDPVGAPTRDPVGPWDPSERGDLGRGPGCQGVARGLPGDGPGMARGVW